MAPQKTDDIDDRELNAFHDCMSWVVIFLPLIVVAITVVVVVAVPSKYTTDYPIFTLQKATTHNFNLTPIPGADSSFLLDTNVNITLLYLNPNRHVTINYDRLSINAVYLGEAIAVPTVLPSFICSAPKIAGAFSTFLNGHSVPVAGTGLEKMPLIPINITVDGWIAWEDQWRSGKMHVNCPCLLRSGYSGAYALGQACTVKVDRDALKT